MVECPRAAAAGPSDEWHAAGHDYAHHLIGRGTGRQGLRAGDEAVHLQDVRRDIHILLIAERARPSKRHLRGLVLTPAALTL